MHFRCGDIVYCVDPFLFFITKIMITSFNDDYYIDEYGACYKHDTLFYSVKNAKTEAHKKLNEFYIKQKYVINNTKE